MRGGEGRRVGCKGQCRGVRVKRARDGIGRERVVVQVLG